MERKGDFPSNFNENPLDQSKGYQSMGNLSVNKAKNFNMSQKGKVVTNENTFVLEKSGVAKNKDEELNSVNPYLSAEYLSDNVSDSTIFEIIQNMEKASVGVRASNEKKEEVKKSSEETHVVSQAEKISGGEVKVSLKKNEEIKAERKNDLNMIKSESSANNHIKPQIASKSPYSILKKTNQPQNQIKFNQQKHKPEPLNRPNRPPIRSSPAARKNPSNPSAPSNFNVNDTTYENLLELDKDLYNKGNGFNSNQLSRLISSVITPAKLNEDCLICYEKFGQSQKIIYLNCFHYFHEQCIKDWLGRKKVCPVCKFEVQIN